MSSTFNNSNDAEPPADAPSDLALWRFAKKLARFYGQAEAEGKMAEFYHLVKCLLEAQWPGTVTPTRLADVRAIDYVSSSV